MYNIARTVKPTFIITLKKPCMYMYGIQKIEIKYNYSTSSTNQVIYSGKESIQCISHAYIHTHTSHKKSNRLISSVGVCA